MLERKRGHLARLRVHTAIGEGITPRAGLEVEISEVLKASAGPEAVADVLWGD